MELTPYLPEQRHLITSSNCRQYNHNS